MLRHFGRTARLLFGLGLALVVAGTIAAVAHHRDAQRAQLAADIHALESRVPRYAIETKKFGPTSDDANWRAYCERQRVSMIEEAHAAAAQ